MRTRPLVHCRLTITWGLEVVEIQPEGGDVQEYRLERVVPSLVILEKRDGTRYAVSPWACDCDDHKYRGRDWVCKHRVALGQLGVMTIAEGHLIAG